MFVCVSARISTREAAIHGEARKLQHGNRRPRGTDSWRPCSHPCLHFSVTFGVIHVPCYVDLSGSVPWSRQPCIGRGCVVSRSHSQTIQQRRACSSWVRLSLDIAFSVGVYSMLCAMNRHFVLKRTVLGHVANLNSSTRGPPIHLTVRKDVRPLRVILFTVSLSSYYLIVLCLMTVPVGACARTVCGLESGVLHP